MISNRKIYLAFYFLLAASALIRGFVAGALELGNDEVYYWTYAKFPALSHFDHPPMVGLVIRFFTLNLRFDGEFFIRLAAVALGTASTVMMFIIGKHIKDALTGFLAALLYTASFYGSVLTGLFMLPDSPQVFFWLLTLCLLLKSLPDRELKPASRRRLLLAGLAAGLALLSKYHAAFLVAGAFFYILFYNRRWFRVTETYGAFMLVLLCCTPVALWNLDNDFISFTYHEGRVGITASGLQPRYFLTELAGQFFYNNPVNVVIILATVFSMVMGRRFLGREFTRIILWISVPLLLVFTSFSLFRSTLPHWTGPAYLGFIFLAAAYLSEPRKSGVPARLIPWPAALSILFFLAVIITATGQIRYGWIPLKRWGIDDVTHDMTGWRQLAVKLAPVIKRWEEQGQMKQGAPILTFRWFPAANLDYYAGTRTGNPVYAIGTLERIHKYHWINRQRGNLKAGSDAWHIALSDDYEDPSNLYGTLYDTIIAADTLTITRGADTVRKAYLFRLEGLKRDMIFR